MGKPQFTAIKSDVVLTSFSSNGSVMIKFQQPTSGRFYYRLRCSHKTGDYAPTDFPVTYLYLGYYDSEPTWVYTSSFRIQSVKNSSLVNTSFESLFTRYSTTAELRVSAELQSSSTSDFSSYDTSDGVRILSIKLSGNNFGPTWTCPTWFDQMYASSAGVAAITGSNQRGLQGVSRFIFSLSQAAARYGTSLDSYSIKVSGGFSHTLTPAEVEVSGTDVLSLETYYKLSGNVTVTFSVEDTRGMSTTFTRTISIISYKGIYLTANNTRRQNGTGSTLILDFEGTWFGSDQITLSCTGIEAKEEGSSTTYASLTPILTVSGTSFSYHGAWSGVSFDPEKAYTISATFTDTVKTVTLTFPVPVGTPVLAIRDRAVGVNNPSPAYALDVNGVIAQNDYPVLGFKGIIGTSESCNLNDYKETGYYIYKADSRDVYNFPEGNSNIQLLLMVICANGNSNQNYGVQKAWEPTAGNEYTRAFHGSSFRSWKKVTMT